MSTGTAAPAYTMPVPHKGQPVLFYPNGVVTPQNAHLGYVLVVSRANVELNVNGMLKETVCHVDDPVVQQNIHARKCGVWDFCPRDKAIDQELATLKARLAALEAAKPSK